MRKMAWACFTYGGLVSYGNGEQFQYPIFYTKKEARDWAIKCVNPQKITVRKVEIRELRKPGRRGKRG